MRKVIIECAVNGGTKRSLNPHTPYTVEETVAAALAACDAGASIIHYHVLGPQGEWSDDIGAYGAVARGIRASNRIGAGALLWPTFAPGTEVSHRFGHFIELSRDPATKPDLGACDMGSLNVVRWDVKAGDFARTVLYQNTLETCREALAQFDHRIGAYVVAVAAVFIGNGARRMSGWARFSGMRALNLTATQLILGIATLLLQAPEFLAAAHQLVAALKVFI